MFDRRGLSDAVHTYGRVARIVLAGHRGSTPRETGTAMLVHAEGISGTIGGGRLELDAMTRARALVQDEAVGGGHVEVLRQPLGPALGQCCGGSVTVVTEIWDAAHFRAVFDHGAFPYPGLYVRRVEGDVPLPDRLHHKLLAAAEASQSVDPRFVDGWLIEQLWRETCPVFIYGAGHVGRALVTALHPLPDMQITLADVRPDLMEGLPDDVIRYHDRPPHEVMAEAPADAYHYIMTPEHEYDLELCHRVLQQPFAYAGLIGSETKWTRFRKRLDALGHSAEQIARITCPIGTPALGKHPAEIAIGVTQELLAHRRIGHDDRKERRA